MVEQFRNDRGYSIQIPYFGIYAAPGQTFTVPDTDNGSLCDDPGFTYLSGSIPDVVLCEDGTFLGAEDSTLLTINGN